MRRMYRVKGRAAAVGLPFILGLDVHATFNMFCAKQFRMGGCYNFGFL